MTLVDFGSNPSLAKVTLLGKKKKNPQSEQTLYKFNDINEYIYVRKFILVLYPRIRLCITIALPNPES